MGCDIHMYLEWRESAEAPWQLLADPPCCGCYGTGKNRYGEEGQACWRCNGQKKEPMRIEEEDGHSYRTGGKIFSDRNYALFTILADVRNSWDYKPLIEDRGLPEDVTEVLKEVLADDADIHSTSWMDADDLTRVLIHGEHYFTHETSVKWSVTGEFVKYIVQGLITPLADKYGSKNVRVVFGFDN